MLTIDRIEANTLRTAKVWLRGLPDPLACHICDNQLRWKSGSGRGDWFLPPRTPGDFRRENTFPKKFQRPKGVPRVASLVILCKHAIVLSREWRQGRHRKIDGLPEALGIPEDLVKELLRVQLPQTFEQT